MFFGKKSKNKTDSEVIQSTAEESLQSVTAESLQSAAEENAQSMAEDSVQSSVWIDSRNPVDVSVQSTVEMQDRPQGTFQSSAQDAVSGSPQNVTSGSPQDAASELPAETAAETDAAVEAGGTSEKRGFFSRLKDGLSKTRNSIVRGMDAVFGSYNSIDEDFYEELEELMIMGDIGINATQDILERLREEVKRQHIKEPSECRRVLIDSMIEQMAVGETAYEFENKQSVIMVIGVNGVGKTTSVGKLAGKLKDQGKRVLIAAADTFRAAAGEQLEEWCHRAGVEMVGGKEGADPASVIFDAVNAAKARKVDVLLCDTAGRLHNKKNLMEELKKMNRIIEREFPDAHRENLVVLDGTTGQNALVQAKEFGEVADLTGIILTKMDGTAKGGIAVAIQSQLQVPVKYIGVGESIDDLQKFDPTEFVNALFDSKAEEEPAPEQN